MGCGFEGGFSFSEPNGTGLLQIFMAVGAIKAAERL